MNRRNIALLGIIFATAASAQDAREYHHPILAPEQVVSLSQVYLEREDLNRLGFKLTSVNFDYLDGEWSLFYEGVEENARPGYHFIVRASNAENPAFRHTPGM